MGDEDELSTFLLDQGGDVVDAILDDNRLLACTTLLTLGLLLGLLAKTLLLLELGLRAILVSQLEDVLG